MFACFWEIWSITAWNPDHAWSGCAKNATYGVRGNHDHHVAQFVNVTGKTGFKYLTTVTRAITQEKIGSADRRFLATLPLTRMVTLDNTCYFMVHATPRDPVDEYAVADVNFWTPRLQDLHSTVVCVGHSHFPYVLEVGDNLVVNPGSVGQPRDGDPRAAYAIIDDHRVDLKRIEYPVQETIRRGSRKLPVGTSQGHADGSLSQRRLDQGRGHEDQDGVENDADLEELLAHRGAVQVTADGSSRVRTTAAGQIVMPGAFNPVHDGHWKLAQAAEMLLGRKVAFELSLTNVDKPDLPWDEAQRRIDQFRSRATLWITRSHIRAQGGGFSAQYLLGRGRYRLAHSSGSLLCTGHGQCRPSNAACAGARLPVFGRLPG